MRVKIVTLYSLPYVVAIASILVGAQQIVPPLRSIGVSPTSDRLIGQTINRALKSDRLPIHRASPQIPEKARTAPLPRLKQDVVVEPETA
jgi:hypothetical protein